MDDLNPWNEGPPPHEGWWPVEAFNPFNVTQWSWWNGKGWSLTVSETEDAATAGALAGHRMDANTSASLRWRRP